LGLRTATKALADRQLFALNDEQWQQFQTVLDRPTEEIPQLKKLLIEPSVFD
jgi:uncharacterized protein (DUF1778 family)